MSPDTSSRTTHKNPKPTLLSFDELPEWYQDNPHVHHGYRPVSGSAAASLASWRYLHNETVNIYSHLVPCVTFLLGEWYILQYLHSRYAAVAVGDDLIFAFFLLTAAACLGLSAAYHTLINHSQAVEHKWLRLDLVGIVLLTAGDLVSGTYMVFWCEPLLRGIYWAMVGPLPLLPLFFKGSSQSPVLTDVLPRVDPFPGIPDGPHRGPPPVPGPAMAGVQGRLLRRHGTVGSGAARSRVVPVRFAGDDAPVRHAILLGRGRVPDTRRLGLCCE